MGRWFPWMLCKETSLLFLKGKHGTEKKKGGHLRKNSTGLEMRTLIFSLQHVFLLPPPLLTPKQSPMPPFPSLVLIIPLH